VRGAAESEEIAKEALGLIEVEWEDLPLSSTRRGFTAGRSNSLSGAESNKITDLAEGSSLKRGIWKKVSRKQTRSLNSRRDGTLISGQG